MVGSAHCTTTSTDVDPSAEGEAAYNYRFENVPPGNYALTVAPPAGASLQSEEDVNLKVESGQLFPQSVMLLAQGIPECGTFIGSDGVSWQVSPTWSAGFPAHVFAGCPWPPPAVAR